MAGYVMSEIWVPSNERYNPLVIRIVRDFTIPCNPSSDGFCNPYALIKSYAQ